MAFYTVVPEDKESVVRGKEIKRSDALKMVCQYRNEQYATLNQHGVVEPTKSIYFKIEELRDFLNKMESAAIGANGCRIYFGSLTRSGIDRYTTGLDEAQKNELVGRMTTIFVAVKDENGVHNELLNDGNPVLLPAYDFGTLCPPAYGCASIPDGSGKSLHYDVYVSNACSFIP